MRDPIDRAVGVVIGASVLASLAGAMLIRPEPLPAASAARWIALAETRYGGSHVFHRTFSIDALDAGAVRSVYSGEPVTVKRGAPYVVSGWAYDPRQRATADKLVVRVDRGPWREARYRLARPDVAASLGLPAIADSGYAARVDTGSLSAGQHDVELATVTAGRYKPMRVKLRFTLAAP